MIVVLFYSRDISPEIHEHPGAGLLRSISGSAGGAVDGRFDDWPRLLDRREQARGQDQIQAAGPLATLRCSP